MDDIRKLFKQKGLRVTPQREAIFRLLAGSKAHPTAEQVYQKVQQTFPSISFTTVYKTMQALEESDLLQRFNTGANVYRYDANIHPHPHFICLTCGRVDDMKEFPVDLNDYIESAARSTPNRLSFINLHFFGYCPQCEPGSQNQ
ncbi:MAG: Fur family transcriptional regulator [Thermacetogeniaceae bacterium]